MFTDADVGERLRLRSLVFVLRKHEIKQKISKRHCRNPLAEEEASLSEIKGGVESVLQ